MRKYILLFSATACLIALSFFLPAWIVGSLPRVTEADFCSAQETVIVTGSGSLEYADQVEIATDLPFVAGDVFVKPGDLVQVGDPLISVDQEQTVNAVAGLLKVGEDFFTSEVLETLSGQTVKLSEVIEWIPTQIYATASGRVTAVRIVKGEIATPDTALITISNEQQIQATVAINEADAQKVETGQSVKITGAAIQGKTYYGKVLRVSPTARKQFSGTTRQTVVDVTVGFDDADSRLKSGYTVKAQITVSPTRSFLCLPYEAIGQDEQGEYVCLYQAGKAKKRYIETGSEVSAGVEIVSGVTPSDRVLYNPESLADDQFVRLVADR